MRLIISFIFFILREILSKKLYALKMRHVGFCRKMHLSKNLKKFPDLEHACCMD